MTPQENQLLQQFLDQLLQVRGIAKDPQADAMISRAVAQQPDAAYLLVQRALLQDQALEAAKAQIAALQSQQQTAASSHGGSFLGSADSWGNSARAVPHTPAPAPGYGMQPSPSPYSMPAQMAQRRGMSGLFGGGGGSFLGSMAATAAGVAGGAFLYQGLQNLLGDHSNPAQAGQHGMADLSGADHGADPLADSGDTSDLAADAGLDDIGGDPGSDGGFGDESA